MLKFNWSEHYKTLNIENEENTIYAIVSELGLNISFRRGSKVDNKALKEVVDSCLLHLKQKQFVV